MSTGTYWNGLPTVAERGYAVVADAPQFPEYWAKHLIDARIPVVRVELDGVNYGGGIEFLDNRDGSGWRKVTEGHGSPAYPSGSLEILDGTWVSDTAIAEWNEEKNDSGVWKLPPRPVGYVTSVNTTKDRSLSGKKRRKARRKS